MDASTKDQREEADQRRDVHSPNLSYSEGIGPPVAAISVLKVV